MIIAHQKSISYVPTTNNGFEAATCLDLPSVPGYDPASLLRLALKLWILGGKRQVTPVERLGECGVSTKNGCFRIRFGHNFWRLGCRMFCLFVVCFDPVQLTFTYFLHHSTHHQAEPLLCGEGYDWYDLWPCKTDHKIRKVQRCSSFACLGGFLIVLFFRVEIPYDFHFFTHELSKNPTTVASGHQSGVSSKVQGSVVICKGLW